MKTVLFIVLSQITLILVSCIPETIEGTYCCGKQESATSLYLAIFSDGTCAMYGQKYPIIYGTYKETTDNSAQYIIQIEEKEYYVKQNKHNQLNVFDEDDSKIFDRIGNTPAIIMYQQ